MPGVNDTIQKAEILQGIRELMNDAGCKNPTLTTQNLQT